MRKGKNSKRKSKEREKTSFCRFSRPTWSAVTKDQLLCQKLCLLPRKGINLSHTGSLSSFGRTKLNKNRKGFKSSFNFTFIRLKNSNPISQSKDSQWLLTH